MNLTQAVEFADIRRGQRPVPTGQKTALEVAEYVFQQGEIKHNPFLYMEPEDWQKKWLHSKSFRLVELPIAAAALSTIPRDQNWVLTRIHARADHPVVVDLNKNKVGKHSVGYVPPIVVLDGKHRFKAASLRGDSHILAWVGEDALKAIEASKTKYKPKEAIGIEAATEFENQTKLYAGGPGSGRHPEGGLSRHDVLSSSGWKRDRGRGANTYTHSDKPGHEVKLSGSGRWSHFIWNDDKYRTAGSGNGGASLAGHLNKYETRI